ncbi:transposase [Pantoea ananatis]|nr:transposase [Pantoea ananatis]
MKKRFSDEQIISILREAEAEVSARELCRKHAISDATFYSWRKKFGGMEASDIKKIKDLEDENRRLKQMFADLSLENRALKDVIEKKL